MGQVMRVMPLLAQLALPFLNWAKPLRSLCKEWLSDTSPVSGFGPGLVGGKDERL